MENVVALQAAIKQQADDLRNELADLNSWANEIRRKDDAIKAKTVFPPDLPPVRGTPKVAAAAPAKPRVDPVAEAKEQGNEFFRKGQWDDAIRCYTKGIDLDPKSASTHVLYSNRAMCFIKLQKWALAESDASTCVDLNKSFAKGFYRRAVARKALGKLEEARRDLEVVLVLTPGDVEADREMQAVTLLLKEKLVKSTAPTQPKKKIVIQEFDDDEEEQEAQRAKQLASQAQEAAAAAELYAATSKAHQENVRAAQEKAAREQRENAEKDEKKRQAARKSHPKVEVLEDDDEIAEPTPAPAPARHVDPAPTTAAGKSTTRTEARPTDRSTESLKPPKNYNEFERTLLDVKREQKLLDAYIGLLSGANLPNLFGISLSPEYLVDILRSIARQPAAKAAELLRGLAAVKRLEELVMFFEADEQAIVRAAIQNAEANLTSGEKSKLLQTFGL